MNFFSSIRTKLTVWYAAWLGATLIAFGGSAYFFTRETLQDNLDRSLRNEVKWVNEFIEPKAKKVPLRRAAIQELKQLKQKAAKLDSDTTDNAIPEEDRDEIDAMWNEIYQHTLLSPRRHYIQILDRNGDLLYRSPSLRKMEITYSKIPYNTVRLLTVKSDDGQEMRLAVTQNDYVKIFVAFPLEPLNEVLDNLFANFGIIAPLALLISVIGGWFLAHKSLRPVDALTRAAREITVENLSRRLPEHSVDDEIGRLTEQFNDMIGRLQESFDQIHKFSADASHELRTPLTIMRGEIEVALRNSKLGKPTRELLESIHDELLRLSSIVESLITLVKSDSGRLSFAFESVSLNDILRQIAADAHVLAEPKRIKVTLQQTEDVIVKGDATRLRQLFLNLVDNAVKYTPHRGRVALSIERRNGNVVVSVRDTGIGIPRKELSKVFERFYRGSSNGEPGSGLGLSIAKWIAEAHHGSIDVESHGRRGSTFTVTLPVN